MYNYRLEGHTEADLAYMKQLRKRAGIKHPDDDVEDHAKQLLHLYTYRIENHTEADLAYMKELRKRAGIKHVDDDK